MLLACRDKSEARRWWWLVQARRISRSIYAPLGPICLEHQDLCRGYSALGPSRVPPIYFYGSVLPAAAGTRDPGESRALMLFRGVAQGKMLQETREGTTDYDREGTNCETRSKLKETTRTRNRVHRECTLS